MPFLTRMEIDAQERQEKELLIQKISQVSFKTRMDQEEKSHAKTAEITTKKLYHEAFELKRKQEKRVSRLQKRIEEKISQKKVTKKSEDLINKKFCESVGFLFGRLDGDKDGLICANRIEFSNLDPKKLKILTPVLLEMEENDAVLDIGQFGYAVKRLCEVEYFPRNY